MFERQWHSPGSQIGLNNISIDFEDSLVKHHYQRSAEIIATILNQNAGLMKLMEPLYKSSLESYKE